MLSFSETEDSIEGFRPARARRLDENRMTIVFMH